jgi:O-antigen/teichoic acid export membrane protein
MWAEWRAKLEARPELKKILTNIGWLSTDRILRMVTGILISTWVARYLGPAQYGVMSYAISFVSLFGAIGALAADNIVVRNLVQNPDKKNEILGSAFLLKVGGACAAIVLVVVCAWLLESNGAALPLIFIYSLGLLIPALETPDLLFQSQVKSRFTVTAKLIVLVAFSLIKIVLILTAQSVSAFVWAGIAESFAGAIALWWAFRLRGERVREWHVEREQLRLLFRDSWALLLTGLVIMIYMRADQLILGRLQDKTELGNYAIAVKLAELIYFLPMALVGSLLPNIVSIKEVNTNLYFIRIQKLFNLVVFIGYAYALVITLLGNLFINYFLGASYFKSVGMLIVLAWAGVFTNIGIARSSVIASENLGNAALASVMLGGIANVLLNLMLIPHYGGMGAAIASLFAYWLQTHGAGYLIPRLRPTAPFITRALLYPKFW